MSRVAVVTGGNKGIGFAIVAGLCPQFEGVVYLTARNETLGRAAVEELRIHGIRPRFHQLDITDDSSVETFKNYLKDTYGGIDVLVNNAGIAFKNNATEPVSIQAAETIRVNYFGTLRVSKALFPLLRPHGRVVQVSSMLGHLSKIPGDQLKARFASPDLTEEQLTQLMNEFIEATKEGNHQELGWPNSTYAVSKVGVSALTRIQQREFDSDDREDLVVNSVHPGYVDTDMTSHQGVLTPEKGAQAPMFLAMLPINTEIRGQFVWHNNSVVDWVNGPMLTPM